MRKFIIAVVALFALVLTGCSTQAASAPDPSASVAQPAALPEPTTEKPKNTIKSFGDVNTWNDGVSISVSEPAPFEVGEYAAGDVDGQTHVVYTLVLTNGSAEPLEPMVRTSVSSGGTEASSIYDTGNALGDIGGSPTTVILPGQTVKWLEAFSLADPNAVTLQVSPSFLHKDTVFTNIK